MCYTQNNIVIYLQQGVFDITFLCHQLNLRAARNTLGVTV